MFLQKKNAHLGHSILTKPSPTMIRVIRFVVAATCCSMATAWMGGGSSVAGSSTVNPSTWQQQQQQQQQRQHNRQRRRQQQEYAQGTTPPLRSLRMMSSAVPSENSLRYFGPKSTPLLDSVQQPSDMKRLTQAELKQLTYELRWDVINAHFTTYLMRLKTKLFGTSRTRRTRIRSLPGDAIACLRCVRRTACQASRR